MKRILLAAATALMLVPPVALAQTFGSDDPVVQYNLEGKMTCEVKSNTVITVEEGKPESYSGIEDGFEIGDKLTFKYSYIHRPGEDNYGLYPRFDMFLKDDARDQTVDGVFSFGENLINGLATSSAEVIVFKELYGGDASFGKDYIRIEGPNIYLRMTRYYKSDWQAIGHKLVWEPPGLHIFTLDCRHVTDSVDEIVEAFWTLIREIAVEAN